jgi:hypothetical protein
LELRDAIGAACAPTPRTNDQLRTALLVGNGRAATTSGTAETTEIAQSAMRAAAVAATGTKAVGRSGTGSADGDGERVARAHGQRRQLRRAVAALIVGTGRRGAAIEV